MAYFITFTCYGTRLHGDSRGSVDRDHCAPGSPYVGASAARVKYELSRMAANPYALGPKERLIVLKAIQDVCAGGGYTLNAVHVRTNHVHVVVSAKDDPENVMGRLKGRASFELSSCDGRSTKRWSRHGSTRYLWTEDEVVSAVSYVLFVQGEAMAMYPEVFEAR